MSAESNPHLFAYGSAKPDEPPTVSPTEAAISKDFELDISHGPSAQPGESTAGSIQVLDAVPDHIGVTNEDVVPSDGGLGWDNLENRRVKVRNDVTSMANSRHISSRSFSPSYLFLSRALLRSSDSAARSTSSSAPAGRT